jgi:hypothetical protein
MRPTLDKFSNLAIMLMAGLLVLQLWEMRRVRTEGHAVGGDSVSFAPDDAVFHQFVDGGRADGEPLISMGDMVPEGCGLVYFFDPECKACNKYASGWAGMEVVGADDLPLPLSWISIRDDADEIDRYISKYQLGGKVFALDARYRPSQIGIAYVPQSFVVSSQGEVLSWGGHLPEILGARLEARPDLFEICASGEH